MDDNSSFPEINLIFRVVVDPSQAQALKDYVLKTLLGDIEDITDYSDYWEEEYKKNFPF